MGLQSAPRDIEPVWSVLLLYGGIYGTGQLSSQRHTEYSRLSSMRFVPQIIDNIFTFMFRITLYRYPLVFQSLFYSSLLYARVRVHVHVCVHIHTRTRPHTRSTRPYTYIHSCVHIHMRTYIITCAVILFLFII